MGQASKQELHIEKFGENLSTFAVNRDDIKELLAAIPKDSNLNLSIIEYELQILKIISIGWALAFYMPESDKNKKPLCEIYWSYIREISQNISSLAGLTTGKQINYFDILKERLDKYVGTLQTNSDKASDTSSIIGLKFSELCNAEDDALVILTGTKIFTFTIGAVKEYLDAVEIKQSKEKNNEN